jgi:GT2 family glycosyltransferase
MAVPRQVIPAGAKALKLHMPAADARFECDINLSSQHDNVLDPDFDQDDNLVELSFAPLFCGLIRPEVIKALGGLDSGNGPHYRSDWILCESIERVLKQKILYTPHSKVYHLQGVATKLRDSSA